MQSIATSRLRRFSSRPNGFISGLPAASRLLSKLGKDVLGLRIGHRALHRDHVVDLDGAVLRLPGRGGCRRIRDQRLQRPVLRRLGEDGGVDLAREQHRRQVRARRHARARSADRGTPRRAGPRTSPSAPWPGRRRSRRRGCRAPRWRWSPNRSACRPSSRRAGPARACRAPGCRRASRAGSAPSRTAGSRRYGLPWAFASRKVIRASSATSNSRSRTTRLNAVLGTLTSANSRDDRCLNCLVTG